MMTCTPMSDAELARLGTRDDAGFGALETARGHLPMTALAVEARVAGLVAELEVAETFENTLAEAIEATYIFPLPDRAAVTRFRMEVAGRVIEGVIDERGRAREQYEEAIAAGHRAAITEEDRPGVFTLRVGNLMPGEVATVRLTLVGPLPVDDGEVTFRFPLVVAPRYIPGRELPGPRAGTGTAADTDAVPDASRITPPVLLPGLPNPVRLALAVTIDGAGVPVGELRSSLHAVTETTRGGARRVEVRPGERLDRDFVLRWSIGEDDVRTGAVRVADADGEGATLVVTVVPPRDAGATRPRDVVFVLDRSGSMQGWKMVAARRAVARMIDTLGERDRFAVLAFDNTIEEPAALPRRALAAASDRHRFRAVEFLARVEARGGTELRAPLVRAVELLAGGYDDRDRVLVLVTDGQVGNEDEILRELAQRVKNVRVFTLGVDQAVNAAFLRRLAAAGGGACELVESEDRLDDVMAKIHRRIGTPVVTELAIRGEGLALDDASWAPRRIPSLFAGAPVVVAARLPRAGGAGGAVVVSGRTPAGQAWSQSIPVTDGRGDAAAAIWARARIRDLEDRYASDAGDRGAIEREIVAVSLRHRVLSRFTAFLAVDRSERVSAGGSPRTITQAVERPAGWADAAAAPARYAGAPRSATLMAPAQAPMPGAPPSMPSIRASAAPPAPPAGAPRSIVSRARKLLSRDVDGELAEAAAAVDAAPYLRRAGELADAFAAAAARGDRRALDLALARLLELADDARSVGGLDELVRALDEIARAARALDPAAPTGWDDVAARLRGLAAAPPASPPPSGRRAFWK